MVATPTAVVSVLVAGTRNVLVLAPVTARVVETAADRARGRPLRHTLGTSLVLVQGPSQVPVPGRP